MSAIIMISRMHSAMPHHAAPCRHDATVLAARRRYQPNYSNSMPIITFLFCQTLPKGVYLNAEITPHIGSRNINTYLYYYKRYVSQTVANTKKLSKVNRKSDLIC